METGQGSRMTPRKGKDMEGITIKNLPDVYPERFRVKIVGIDDPNYEMVDGVEGEVVYISGKMMHISCDCD